MVKVEAKPAPKNEATTDPKNEKPSELKNAKIQEEQKVAPSKVDDKKLTEAENKSNVIVRKGPRPRGL